MHDCGKDIEQRQAALIQELTGLEPFRRGSVNTVYRKCGKKDCICTKEGHPGHGPMATLTFKEQNTTRTRSIPPAAVDLVQRQINARSQFLDWCNRWRALSEQISDGQVQGLISRGSEPMDGKKKSFRTWPTRSGAKSKR